MVMARLHIICGNCGCNDMFSWKIQKDYQDFGDYQKDDVCIYCKNCGTIHTLSDVIGQESEED